MAPSPFVLRARKAARTRAAKRAIAADPVRNEALRLIQFFHDNALVVDGEQRPVVSKKLHAAFAALLDEIR